MTSTTEISWTGTGEEELQEALGIELIKWCETTPVFTEKAVIERGGVRAASAGGAGTGGAVVHVSSNRYERVQAAAAHGMLASMNVIGAGAAGRIPGGGVANDANLQIQADDGMMAKQPRYAQRKRPLREVKGEKTK